jgi:hypothetical protein
MENSENSSGEFFIFNIVELEALYRVLEREYISYKDEMAYQTVKKIADIIHEKLDRRAGTTAQ